MTKRFFIIWIFIYAVCDRIREIAIFPGWESRLGPWFDTYNADSYLDAYHVFKWLPFIVLLVVITNITRRRGYIVGFTPSWGFICLALIAWAAGQYITLLLIK